MIDEILNSMLKSEQIQLNYVINQIHYLSKHSYE